MACPEVIMITESYVFDVKEWLEELVPDDKEREALNNGDVHNFVEELRYYIENGDLEPDALTVEQLGECNV